VTDNSKPPAQRFLNGEVHDWYRILLGYSDHLVSNLLDRFDVGVGGFVLDPFCGSGTTLVECMKRKIPCVGIDANPSSCFASRVKTNWSLKGARLLTLLGEVEKTFPQFIQAEASADPTFQYLRASGMLKRGWISSRPLEKAIALKSAIDAARTTSPYRNALMLALIAEVVVSGSNMRFGPEPYCGPKKKDADLLETFSARVRSMARDLNTVSSIDSEKALILEGDSRQCSDILTGDFLELFSTVICSPPYPAEHDYTRHSRLELAFLEAVIDRDSLRKIKKAMIRSHTKGIYKEDEDSAHLLRSDALNKITQRISVKAARKSHGFARLYSTVVKEYFGGMKRHLESLLPFLKPGANCAYVVGDQSCYLRVHIPTAEILSEIVTSAGFDSPVIEHWRERWSTTTSKMIDENILFFQKPLN
jgi:hypothetical protein